MLAGLQRDHQHGGVVDKYDAGRGVQLSCYGDPANQEFIWNNQPWALNAIEGGSWHGGTKATMMPSRGKQGQVNWSCRGVNWATGQRLDYSFDHKVEAINAGKALRIDLACRYVGNPILPGPRRHQETPAFFFGRKYDNLFYATIGTKGHMRIEPYQLSVVPPMVPRITTISEYGSAVTFWAVDDAGYGIRVSTRCEALASYLFLGDGQPSACSYIAPLTSFGWGESWTGSIDVTIGDFRRDLD